jgi:hypothetical protein
MENYTSVGQALKAKNFGTFINTNGEYCTVSRFYIKNNLKYQVVFSKGFDIATRPAMNTTFENKVLKLLSTENYKLVNQ